MNRIAISLIFLLMCTLAACAQKLDDKLANESWVRIMHNDTSVNYFIAKKDFAKFVAEHKKQEAEERKSEHESARVGEEHPKEEHLRSPEDMMIQAFQQWAKSVRAFVTADGKVMPVEQRVAVVNKGR